jgi:hypothetical protein
MNEGSDSPTPPIGAAAVRRTFPIFLVLLGLAHAAPANASRHCVGMTPYGDRVTALNDFQTQGISCSHALIAAADYVDSYIANEGFRLLSERGASVMVQFAALAPTGSYNWRCRLAELPPRERRPKGSQVGWRYQCHVGNAQMSFKWWTLPERRCPSAPPVEDLKATRNEPCPLPGKSLEPEAQGSTRNFSEYDSATKRVEELSRSYYRDSDLTCNKEWWVSRPANVSWQCWGGGHVSPVRYTWHETAPA